MKLLIVDDHPVNLKLLRAQLEAEGHETVLANDGVEALQMLDTHRVDGVISDILMPRMDGYRLCLEVRKNAAHAGLPFVLYTSTYNSPADRELATAAGADAYISKPAPTQTLLAALRAAAGASRKPLASAAGEAIESPVLRQYNEILVRKLEDKSAELERAFDGLSQTEARLSGLVETAMDAIIACDEQQHVTLFNTAAEQMFGYPRGEAIGSPLGMFIPQRFRNSHGQLVEQFGQTGGTQRMGAKAVWALHRNGTEFPIEASISRLETSRGRLFTVVIRDVTARKQAQDRLQESERRFSGMLDNVHLISMMLDRDGRITYCNDFLLQLTGWRRDEVIGKDWFETFLPSPAEDPRAVFAALLADRPESWHHENDILTRSGEHRLIRWNNSVLRDTAGEVAGTASIGEDITERRHAELRIRRLNRVLAMLSGINTLIVRTSDRDELFREACRIAIDEGKFLQAWIGMVDADRKAVRFVTGRGKHESSFHAGLRAYLDSHRLGDGGVLANVIDTRQPALLNDLARDPDAIREAVEAGSMAVVILPLICEGIGVGVLVLHADVAGFFDDEEMKLLHELAGDISFALDDIRKSEQLHYHAQYDLLTGLPNRRLFGERLSQAILSKNGDGSMLAVVLVDLERFRNVNETLGRAAGDELIRQVASRLQHANETTARIGVDTFVFKIRDARDAADIARTVDDVLARCFNDPFVVQGHELRIAARSGVAVFPDDGAEPEALLRNAEAALRRGKTTQERCVFYAPVMNARAAEALTMESQLRRAIERQEFVLHYQPKITLADRRITSVEALIRWQHPERGLVPPMQFIPVLEACGLIGTVGEWAILQSLADQRRWRADGLPAPRIAVNVSPLQLRRKDFAEAICAIVASSQGGQLELEITESVMMEEVDRNIGVLGKIREADVSIAIDDFGTGFSSLAYIARLPVTCLKIDRAFINGMVEGPEGLAIVSSILGLAHSLQLVVVAEGVETEEQARLLHLLRCEEAQGYLFSKPLPGDRLEMLLRYDAPLPSS